MAEHKLVFDQILGALFSAIPELWRRIADAFGDDYDLETELPEAYPIFEDVVKRVLFELLEGGRNEPLLRRLFHFFEAMATTEDGYVRDPFAHRDN